MSAIKIKSEKIISACDFAMREHQAYSSMLQEEFFEHWADQKQKDREGFRIKVLRLMASSVQDTSYPYVIVSFDDFCVLNRYLCYS